MIDREQATIRQNILYLKNNGYDIKTYRKLLFNYWSWIDKAIIYDSKYHDYRMDERNIVLLTKPESINRAYRKLVEDGKIVLPENEIQDRASKEEEYRKHFGRNKV